MVMYFIVSAVIAGCLFPFFIAFLNQKNHQQAVSEYSLESFKIKQKTPTLGGVIFVLIPLVVMLILDFKSFSSIKNILVYLTYFGYALIGFVDDLKIILEKNNKGLPARVKFTAQVILALVFFILYRQYISTEISIPFIKGLSIDLGWFYALLVLLMFSGASNGVNLTDGMDGLAGGTSFLAMIPFIIFAYLQHETSLVYFGLALLGSLATYLFFNRHPARIFMGDTGALALGAVLAAYALVLKQEVSLILIGGVFVFETACVMLQIGSVKLRKKRIFKYTPIHYSFTLSGWKETNVVKFFWFLGFIFMGLGLWAGLSI